MKVVVLIVTGYIVAFPAAVWCVRDLRTFHRPLWTGYGNRRTWTGAVVGGYLLTGWPALVIALGWRTSQVRRELIDARRRNSTSGTHGSAVHVA